MAIATAAMREQMAQAYAAEVLYVGLHSANPGATGANEISGTRVGPISWTAGSADGIYTSGSISFTVPAGTTISHLGFWDSPSGGVFLDSAAAAVTFVTAGTYTVTLTYTQS